MTGATDLPTQAATRLLRWLATLEGQSHVTEVEHDWRRGRLQRTVTMESQHEGQPIELTIQTTGATDNPLG